MTTLVCLPLDDRPVNYDYLRHLATMAGMNILLPPREWLGNPWRPSQHTNLINWLEETAQKADVLLLAVDTLAYGGLIPSRTSLEPVGEIMVRLEMLKKLKANNPKLNILASSVILRISRADSAEEEKAYWATYGSRMFRLSYLEHKSALGEASPVEAAERTALRAQIPDEVYQDYLAGRERNHAVNRAMLSWLAEGVFDYLILPQDDTADYGWNIAEARALQMLIRREGLTGRAITYPGADEIGCLLLARCLCSEMAFQPKVFARFSSSSSASIVTEYEDRPMLELLKAHLAPLQGVVCDEASQADIQLFINAPAIKQGVGELQWSAQFTKEEMLPLVPEALKPYVEAMYSDEYFQMTRREMQTPRRSPEEFCRAIIDAVHQGQNVAVADVAFVNGSDLVLGRQLIQNSEIANLAGYAGWNTAGNTLGTVLAQAVIYTLVRKSGFSLEQKKAHLEFLFLRFLDDYCYQALERSLCMLEDMPLFGLQPGEERLPEGQVSRDIERRVAERLLKQAGILEKKFIEAGQLKSVQLIDIYLPWQRLFEIGCTVCANL
jgi:hypothetical protein